MKKESMTLKLLCANCLKHLKMLNKRRRDIMMAKVYFNRLIIGTITFDAIPEKYQEKVKGYGIEYVKKGKLSVEEYEMLYKEEYQEA